VLVISGDRHWSEFSVFRDAVPYPLYDFTSSSLNQIHPRGSPTANRFRAVPQTYHRPNFGEILIDWEGADPKIAVWIRDVSGDVQLEISLRLSELRVP
jgi:alkaline phosphatase D